MNRKNIPYQWLIVHALHVTMIPLVAARVQNEPALHVTLGSQLQVLGSTLLLVFKVLASHPSHVGIAMQSSESSLFPLLVHQVLQLIARQCGPNQEQEQAQAMHLQDESFPTTVNFRATAGGLLYKVPITVKHTCAFSLDFYVNLISK